MRSEDLTIIKENLSISPCWWPLLWCRRPGNIAKRKIYTFGVIVAETFEFFSSENLVLGRHPSFYLSCLKNLPIVFLHDRKKSQYLRMLLLNWFQPTLLTTLVKRQLLPLIIPFHIYNTSAIVMISYFLSPLAQEQGETELGEELLRLVFLTRSVCPACIFQFIS